MLHMGYYVIAPYGVTNLKGKKIMQAILKGNFVENETVKKKDGTSVPVAIVLSGKETVRINRCNFTDVRKFQEVELLVDIRSSEYGLYITPVEG